jgi:type IV pilus assembly protein PilC
LPQYYRYRAINGDGKKVNGYISSPSRHDAALELEKRGLYPLFLATSNIPGGSLSGLQTFLLDKIGYGRCRSRDLMIFCRQLATMLQAGIPVLRALNILSVQLENASLRNNIRAAASSLEKGAGITEALAGQNHFFPRFLISMVEAGEAGGVLDLVMERSASHYERQHDLEEKIRSATAYPLFISTVALAVVAVMILFVLPRFAIIFSQMETEMPLFSRLMLSMGQLVIANWLVILIILFVIAFITALFLQTKKGRLITDYLKLHLPLFGKIYMMVNAARFARTLSTLLSSGLNLYQSLRIADRVINNLYVSRFLKTIELALQRGEPLADSLQASRFFPPLLAEMVRTGEETGTIDIILDKTACYYEKEVSYLVDRLGTILEPILLLVVGFFIGLIVFSVLSPMYSVFEIF